MPSRIRKFELGEPFEDMDDFVAWCAAGNYAFGPDFQKPCHGAFFMSQRIQTVHSRLSGYRKAKIRQEWLDAEKERKRSELQDNAERRLVAQGFGASDG